MSKFNSRRQIEMSTIKIFTTRADAAARLSGTEQWSWGRGASHDGWIDYAYKNQEKIVRNEDGNELTYNHLLADYLRSYGEDPFDYDL